MLILSIIISISKLLGNYNSATQKQFLAGIISISKLLGNYNEGGINNSRLLIFYGGSSNIYAEVGSATRIEQESGPTSFLW